MTVCTDEVFVGGYWWINARWSTTWGFTQISLNPALSITLICIMSKENHWAIPSRLHWGKEKFPDLLPVSASIEHFIKRLVVFCLYYPTGLLILCWCQIWASLVTHGPWVECMFPSAGQPLSSHSLAIPEAVEQAHDPPIARDILVEVDFSMSQSDSLWLQVQSTLQLRN